MSESLSPAKRKLLEARLARASASAERDTRIPRRPPVDRFPATSPQRRFWFVDALNPGDPAYNMHVVLELDGVLDVDRLRSAFREVVDRHEALRSRFVFEDGELWQLIDRDCAAELDYYPQHKFGETEPHLVGLARRPFSLDTAPLIRACVNEIDATRHILLIVVHHIVSDEPSLALIVRDLARAYAQDRRAEADAPSDALRFSEYACWQHDRLPDVLDDHLPYWTRNLAGLEERTRVPVTRNPPAGSLAAGAIVTLPVERSGLQAAQALAAEERTTLLTVMLAAWTTLLARYTGHSDIAVGTPVSLRTAAELGETVGLFLNTVVLRTAFDPESTFRDLVRQSREVVLGAFSHQEVPLESIVEALNPRRGGGDNPFFDTMVVQEDAAPDPDDPDGPDAFDGLEVRARRLDTGVCKFDLTLFFRETRDGMLLSLEYDTRLYDRRRAERVLEHFARLLRTLADEPDTGVADVQYLGREELDWLARHAGSRWPDVGASTTVAEQVERSLAGAGEAPAIVDARGSVSYRELGRLVHETADRIAASAGKPDCVVILLGRDRSAVAAMLAAWRIGSCYVPLDPAYPAARIRDTLDALRSSGSLVVLTASRHESLLPEDVSRILVDRPRVVDSARTQSFRPPKNDDPAYIIFTSGSSGQPKGVIVTHENLRVSTGARHLVYGDGGGDARFLLLSPFAFDSSVAGLYWTLSQGGTLVIADDDQVRDAREILELVTDKSISHTLLLPSLYELVLDAAGDRPLDSLRAVVVAGEACPASLHAAHSKAAPNAALYNEYGPTEATVWATVHEVAGADDPVPIGMPVPSMRAFVLDAAQRPQAPGLPGELCLSGPAVSPGYVGGAADGAFEETEVFGGRERIYRTGDRVRLDDRGRLLFLGRIDRQVKVRGHRVELDEINAAVRRLFDVRDVATSFDADRQVLRTYVAGAGPGTRPDDVTASLRDALPDYMVPRFVTFLDDLPRLPNGKLDTAALPAPAAQADDDAEPEPADESYRQLRQIWCDVLGIDDAAPASNFFDLGGHSLLAARLLVRVDDGLGIRRSLRTLYLNPTLLDFHRALEAGDEPLNENRILYPVRPEGDAPPLFAVATYLDHVLPKIDESIPVFGLTYGEEDPGDEVPSMHTLANRYLRVVRQQQPAGPYRFLGYSFGALIALEMAHQVVDAGGEMGPLVLLDPPPPVPEGDVRYRLKRLRHAATRAGGTSAALSFAATEAARIAGRRLRSLKLRLAHRVTQAKQVEAERDVHEHAASDWAKRARRAYEHRPYPGDVLLVLIGREGFESDEAQIARWSGILDNATIRVIRGPQDHLSLMQPPWSDEVAAEINAAVEPADERGTTASRRRGRASRK